MKKVDVKFRGNGGYWNEDVEELVLSELSGITYKFPENNPEKLKEDKKFLKKNYFRGYAYDIDGKEKITKKTSVSSKDHDVYARWGRSRIPLILLILIILAIIGGLLCCSDWFDKSARQGHWEGKSEEQIRADLNAEVRDGEMNVSIANTVKFFNGCPGEGVAHIENIEANHLDQKVTLYLEDNEDDILYESGAIAPGYSIDNIYIKKHLDNGVYKAIALFTGYDRDTHQKKGQVAAKINLYVENSN